MQRCCRWYISVETMQRACLTVCLYFQSVQYEDGDDSTPCIAGIPQWVTKLEQRVQSLKRSGGSHHHDAGAVANR